jgi:hypothetical protein
MLAQNTERRSVELAASLIDAVTGEVDPLVKTVIGQRSSSSIATLFTPLAALAARRNLQKLYQRD